jgi:hypothetical protein
MAHQENAFPLRRRGRYISSFRSELEKKYDGLLKKVPKKPSGETSVRLMEKVGGK